MRYEREREEAARRAQQMYDQMHAHQRPVRDIKPRKTIDVEFEVVDNRSQYHTVPTIVSTALEGTPAGGLGPGEQAKS
jgi:hypothetical protein